MRRGKGHNDKEHIYAEEKAKYKRENATKKEDHVLSKKTIRKIKNCTGDCVTVTVQKGTGWIHWRELSDAPSLFSLGASAQRGKVRKYCKNKYLRKTKPMVNHPTTRKAEFRAMLQGGSDLRSFCDENHPHRRLWTRL